MNINATAMPIKTPRTAFFFGGMPCPAVSFIGSELMMPAAFRFSRVFFNSYKNRSLSTLTSALTVSPSSASNTLPHYFCPFFKQVLIILQKSFYDGLKHRFGLLFVLAAVADRDQ